MITATSPSLYPHVYECSRELPSPPPLHVCVHAHTHTHTHTHMPQCQCSLGGAPGPAGGESSAPGILLLIVAPRVDVPWIWGHFKTNGSETKQPAGCRPGGSQARAGRSCLESGHPLPPGTGAVKYQELPCFLPSPCSWGSGEAEGPRGMGPSSWVLGTSLHASSGSQETYSLWDRWPHCTGLFPCHCLSLWLNSCLKDLHLLERHSYAAPAWQTIGDGTQNHPLFGALKKKKTLEVQKSVFSGVGSTPHLSQPTPQRRAKE